MTLSDFDKCQTCGHLRPNHNSMRDFEDMDDSCFVEGCTCQAFVFDSEDHARRVEKGEY